MKLTAKNVATLALPVGKLEAIFYDEDFPGFGLRLRGGGSRTWVFGLVNALFYRILVKSGLLKRNFI